MRGRPQPRAERVRAPRRGAGPGRTADGHAVALLVNIGSAADLTSAADAEGVGLFRTEFLFLDRQRRAAPGRAGRRVRRRLRALRARRTVVRTLDAGADKPLPFLGPTGRAEPRARRARPAGRARRPEILRTQLRGHRASRRPNDRADVWVMAPMVARPPPEARRFAERVPRRPACPRPA